MSDPAVSGLAADVRKQLIIDRYSSVLSRLPLRRQTSLADPGSRDAEIWNTFRILEQLDPARWLPGLLAAGKIRAELQSGELAAGVGITLWKRVKPPPERLDWLRRQALRGRVRPPIGRRRKGRVIPLSALRGELKEKARERIPLEDPVEVDVIVKTRGMVLFVEIPEPREHPEDPSDSDSGRTHLLRLLDAGLSYAEARSRARRRPIDFALLVLPEDGSPKDEWRRALARLTTPPSRLRASLPHRGSGFNPPPLARRLGVGAWSAMGSLLAELRQESTEMCEAALLDHLLRSWRSAGSPATS